MDNATLIITNLIKKDNKLIEVGIKQVKMEMFKDFIIFLIFLAIGISLFLLARKVKKDIEEERSEKLEDGDLTFSFALYAFAGILGTFAFFTIAGVFYDLINLWYNPEYLGLKQMIELFRTAIH